MEVGRPCTLETQKTQKNRGKTSEALVDEIKEQVGRNWHHIAQSRTAWKIQGEAVEKEDEKKKKLWC